MLNFCCRPRSHRKRFTSPSPEKNSEAEVLDLAIYLSNKGSVCPSTYLSIYLHVCMRNHTSMHGPFSVMHVHFFVYRLYLCILRYIFISVYLSIHRWLGRSRKLPPLQFCMLTCLSCNTPGRTAALHMSWSLSKLFLCFGTPR